MVTDENRRIVDEIARLGTLENIIRQVTSNSDDPDLLDLQQDLYISLLVDAKLSGIYERGELNFYLARLVLNNIASKTSPYYRIYKRYQKLSEPIRRNSDWIDE